jgi:branched-chain amino acid transport system substrate-binding protein
MFSCGPFSVRVILCCILGAVMGCTHRAPTAPAESPRPVIRLLTHVPLSGPLAQYSAVSRAAQAYFQEQNKKGGVQGSLIDLSVIDSGDSPARTRTAVTKRLLRRDVFALFQPLGDPGQLALLDNLDTLGVPTFFMASGLSVYTRPFRPNVFVSNPTYEDVGRSLAAYLAVRKPPSRIALIFLGRASGKEFAVGVRSALPDGSIVYSEEVQFDTEPEALAARLARFKADVVIAFMLSKELLELIRASGSGGFTPQWASAFLDRLIEDGGELSEGILSAHWLRLPQDEGDPNTPVADRRALQAHRAMLSRNAPGLEPSAMTVGGQAAAELFIEVLERAGPRPTRAQVVQAAERVHAWRCSLCLIDAQMSDHDHAPYERVRILRAAHGRWLAAD